MSQHDGSVKVPVHYVGSWLTGSGGVPRGRTECRIECWKCSPGEGEADTVAGDRIDYAEIWKRVTCAACLRKRRGIR